MSEVVLSDGLDYLRSLPDGSVDLLVLDPDYQDWHKLIEEGLIEEARRVIRDSGNILCFTKQPFDYELRTAVDNMMRREIVWSFENGGAWVSNKMPLVSFQKIYWCVKSKDFFFQPRTGMAYSKATKNFKRASKVFGGYEDEGKTFTKSADGIWIRDHLHFNKPNTGTIPAKPKPLADIFVRCFCPEGGIVCDPFAGTGTFAKSADEQGKEFLCSEIDEDRCMKILDYFFEKGSRE